MGSPRSTPGRPRVRVLSAWGVEVRMPRSRRWTLLTKPGREEPLATSLAHARAWADDWAAKGCQARLVELQRARGGGFRPRPPVPPPQLPGQLALL